MQDCNSVYEAKVVEYWLMSLPTLINSYEGPTEKLLVVVLSYVFYELHGLTDGILGTLCLFYL
ncbi:MAG: hypothetical protein RLZZ262_1710 [Bacteroidota bacterium]|jgi:hypothetical protein